MAKIVLPGQTIRMDSDEYRGIDPIWYEKLQQLVAFANLFSAVDPSTLTNGQVLIWDATAKKFLPGAN